MEGSVNLQTEGHIGVVCFGKFNASIEARRLPPDWKWVPNESPEAQGFEETASVITADDHGVVRQIHSTGFWADGNGEKVKGKLTSALMYPMAVLRARRPSSLKRPRLLGCARAGRAARRSAGDESPNSA